jgi:hypothetical protein
VQHWTTKVSLKQKVYELEIWRVFRFLGFNFGWLRIKRLADGVKDGDNAERK